MTATDVFLCVCLYPHAQMPGAKVDTQITSSPFLLDACTKS